MENTFELWFCYKQSQEKCNCLTPGFLCFKWNKMIFSDILKIIVIFAVDDGQDYGMNKILLRYKWPLWVYC